MNDKPNWPEGDFSAESLKQVYSMRKNNYLQYIKSGDKPIGDVIIKDEKFIKYLNNRIYTLKVNLETLVDTAKVECLKIYPKEQAKCDELAKLIINKVRDSKEPLKGRKQVSSLFYKDNTGIAGTPPYKKPGGFMGSTRLKGDTDPSDTRGVPNWVDGYFSVAYLQKIYDGFLTQTDPNDANNKMIIDKYPSLKYYNDDIKFVLSRSSTENTPLETLIKLRDTFDTVNNYTVNQLIKTVNTGDEPCVKYSSRMKQPDKRVSCENKVKKLLALEGQYLDPLNDDVDEITAEKFPGLPVYNNPDVKKSKWPFGGKRKQRRTKTNKIRTRTNTKKIKNTKKKNKRVKHSKKTKKARKSRNARKTRKH